MHTHTLSRRAAPGDITAACHHFAMTWDEVTPAARHPERFDGLFEHWELHAGPCAGMEPPNVRGHNRGYVLALFQREEDKMATVVSDGLRFQPITTALEQELACTVRVDQIGAAHALVDLTSALTINNRHGLEYDQILDNDRPVLDGTDMIGVITLPHPYFGEDFDLFHDATGKLQLQMITLVPATEQELVFADEHGAEALYKLWHERSTDLLDVSRPSAIP